ASTPLSLHAALPIVNGFAQAMLWPPLVKIISGRFSDNAYKKAVVWVSSGGLLATVIVYLCAPLIIHVSGWRPVFYVSASAAFGRSEEHTSELQSREN